MERRHFLKIAFGFAAGAAVLATSLQAAPLAPQPFETSGRPPLADVRPAVTSAEEASHLKPEQVHWGHHWHHRHWGWHHHRHWGWHHRHWGWRHHHWHRHWHRHHR
jgi:hypothetical protein